MIAQEQFDAKAQHLYSEVDSLLDVIRSSINDMTPVHVIEEKTLKGVLALGKSLMQLLFDLLGAGDVGPTCELPDGRVVKRLDELRTRPYQSVFGLFELKRCVYAEREGQKIELVFVQSVG